jgi:transposase
VRGRDVLDGRQSTAALHVAHVGQIIARVVADLDDDELLEGVTRIGIDEISYRRRYRFLLVVVDHDRHRLIHAVNGANASSLGGFFDLLGEEKIFFSNADGYMRSPPNACELKP